MPEDYPTEVISRSDSRDAEIPLPIFSHQKNFHKPLIVDGKSNVNIKNSKIAYFWADKFTYFVDCHWVKTILVFFLSFVICWVAFALLYFSIAQIYIKYEGTESNRTCIKNVQNFTGAYLFSMESQHTIGYGFRYITEDCWAAIIVLSFQCMISVILHAIMVGIVFAKITRSKMRTSNILFSKHLTIRKPDKKENYYMTFKIADVGKSAIINLSVKVIVIKKTLKRQTCSHQIEEIKLETGGLLLFLWPIEINHVIDEQSPLYGYGPKNKTESIEFIIILEGVGESTGSSLQARHSYHSMDILWDKKFVEFQTECVSDKQHSYNFTNFNTVVDSDEPLPSS